MKRKVSELLRFLGGCGIALALLGVVVLRVTGCSPQPAPSPGDLAGVPSPPPISRAGCQARERAAAAARNSATLNTLAWSPFGRREIGWATYAPIIAREIGTACAPDSEGFAAAYAKWQASQGLSVDGVVDDAGFDRMRVALLMRRPFVRLTETGVCPAAPATVTVTRPEESYGGRVVSLRPAALAAYRRMVGDARRQVPGFADDPSNLKVFSGFRSPLEEAERCTNRGCDGVVRARCSAHRTGLALDIYMGHAPGFRPDDSADANRRFMTKTPTYRWLLSNAHRYGFVNYPFEPWHWEWTGEPP